MLTILFICDDNYYCRHVAAPLNRFRFILGGETKHIRAGWAAGGRAFGRSD